MHTTLTHPKQIRDLFQDLLGRRVTLETISRWSAEPGEPTCVAEFITDTASLQAVVILDLPLTIYAGAALGLTPAAQTKEMIKDKKPRPNTLADLTEILNVASAIFNMPGAPHTRLGQVHAPGDPLPTAVGELVHQRGGRLDLSIDVVGYGGGRMAIVMV